MCEFLIFCQRLKKHSRLILRILGECLICIPLLYSKWIEFRIRKVELPEDRYSSETKYRKSK